MKHSTTGHFEPEEWPDNPTEMDCFGRVGTTFCKLAF